MVFQIFFQALILGLVIAILERDGVPDLVPLVISIGSIIIATLTFVHALPDSLHVLGFVLGGMFGAYIISWVFKVSFQRGLLIAGVYMGFSLALRLGWTWLMNA